MGTVTQDDLKRLILEKGCYSPKENLRIYNQWFATAPRYMFQAVDRSYDLRSKVICDVGCCYGMNLSLCKPGSYGIEINQYEARFGNSIGLTIYERDIVSESVSDLPLVDAIWCSAVLEHVESPHSFLRQLARLLKPGGLLAVYVPTIPLIPAVKNIAFVQRYLTAYLHDDHVNAFVPSTLRFYCERAGFKTLEVSPFYPSPLSILNHIPLMNRLLSGCVYVGSKLPDWDYPEHATRRVTDTQKGFSFKHEHYLQETLSAESPQPSHPPAE